MNQGKGHLVIIFVFGILFYLGLLVRTHWYISIADEESPRNVLDLWAPYPVALVVSPLQKEQPSSHRWRNQTIDDGQSMQSLLLAQKQEFNQSKLKVDPNRPLGMPEPNSVWTKQFLSSIRMANNKFPMPLEFHPYPTDGKPPFHAIVDKQGNVTGDVANLLSFALIGFGKCGSTSMMRWLDSHPNLQSYPEEVYDLIQNSPHFLLRRIYSMPEGNFQRGYKSPMDITVLHALRYFIDVFPTTKLFIGIRHPVTWFQSLYNFRLQNLSFRFNVSDYPHPNDVIGRCSRRTRNICTQKAEFALYLRNLGKTLSPSEPNGMTKFERQLYQVSGMVKIPDVQRRVSNPVFLFDVEQLTDNDTVREQAFRSDVQKFLGVDKPFPPMIHERPGKSIENAEQQAARDARKIDICHQEYLPVRRELMRLARVNSVWIQKYFLRDPSVVVSTPEYFHELMQRWMIDPCNNEDTKSAGQRLIQYA